MSANDNVEHAADISPKRRRSLFTFSLSSLLLAMLLVAVFLAGRQSNGPPTPSAMDGAWEAKMPQGAIQPTTLTRLDGDIILLSSRASVFNGEYRWQNGHLTMNKPADRRMNGLVWRLRGDSLLLVGEPTGTPTGASYLGTKLQRATTKP